MVQGCQITKFHTTVVYLSTDNKGPIASPCCEAQSIVLRARHNPAVFDQVGRFLIQTDSANNARGKSPFRDCDPRLGTPTADMFVTVCNISVQVSDSDSGATSTGGTCRCSVFWLAGEISVHVFLCFPCELNKAFQKLHATQNYFRKIP